jgi:tetratricopeptide (TPR) repeat protein
MQLRMRELLGRATLLRARGQRQEALELAQQAVSLEEGSWEAHELVGDLLVELGRGELALDSYRRARELNSSRTALEDKLARAALARAARLERASRSDALLTGRDRKSGV